MTQREEFDNLLLRNDEEEVKEYIKRYGKPRKPISPLFFILKEGENEDGRTKYANEGIAVGDQGSDEETKVG